MTERISADRIAELKPNEIFVFGSNSGTSWCRAAKLAMDKWELNGARNRLEGQTYAIPTMQGGIDTIKPYVDKFIAFAKKTPIKYSWLQK